MPQKEGWKSLKSIDTQGIYEKITVAGNIITVRRYQSLNLNGGGRVERPEGESADAAEYYKRSQKARRENVRNLCTTNFDNSSKFLTLTFSDTTEFDIRDVVQCNRQFTLFIKRLKRRFDNLKYLAVIEFQDKNARGAVHYHLLCNLPYVRKSELAKLWGHGFIKINAIDKVTNIGAYISKYMTENMDDTRLQGLKAYQHSRNLEQPVEVRSWRNEDDFSLHLLHKRLDEKAPTYSAKYMSAHSGFVEFLQYNLNEIIADWKCTFKAFVLQRLILGRFPLLEGLIALSVPAVLLSEKCPLFPPSNIG